MHNDQGPFLPLWAHGLGVRGGEFLALRISHFAAKGKLRRLTLLLPLSNHLFQSVMKGVS